MKWLAPRFRPTQTSWPANAGHPRLSGGKQGVDDRDKRGHDGTAQWPLVTSNAVRYLLPASLVAALAINVVPDRGMPTMKMGDWSLDPNLE